MYVGNALGYILPPTIISGPENWVNGVPSNDWTEEDYESVKSQLIWMHSISFGVAAVVYIGLIVIYNKEPSGAPNKAEAVRICKANEQNRLIIEENNTKLKQWKARVLIFVKSVKGSVEFFWQFLGFFNKVY